MGLQFLRVLAALIFLPQAWGQNRTYTNPILPGWHSDPSCVFVAERDNTTFCTTSSFLAFPGCPVYASKDLIHWKLASNALDRNNQIPGLLVSNTSQSEGPFANTLRYREGVFYLITIYVSKTNFEPTFLLFKTTDPFQLEWEGPLAVSNPGRTIDPDIFWDDDGSVYVASAGVFLQKVDLDTGAASDPVSIWNGTGGAYPEGPHLYKKDGWYYLLIAEGGTELRHSATIARSKNVYGPYESYERNPILTNRGTDEYFQTVGHADLFQDVSGNWWGAALATRSGPAWEIYPMGRESVLFPVQWLEGAWPAPAPVRGVMSGPLPPVDTTVPALGQWVDSADVVDFEPGSQIPLHFVHWRPPPNASADYTVSPPGPDANTLALRASHANLTGGASYSPAEGQTFLARRQSHTLFNFSVDLAFSPAQTWQEAGITVFLTNYQHIDLSMIGCPGQDGLGATCVQLRTEASGKPNATFPEPVMKLLPCNWTGKQLRLTVEAKNDYEYEFSVAAPVVPQSNLVLGTVGADIVSGGSGPFTGSLLGVFATTNGEIGAPFQAHFSRWRYLPVAQQITN